MIQGATTTFEIINTLVPSWTISGGNGTQTWATVSLDKDRNGPHRLSLVATWGQDNICHIDGIRVDSLARITRANIRRSLRFIFGQPNPKPLWDCTL